MRFLITGGAGFIGVALANYLTKEGHHVRVLDDLSAGDPSRLSDAVSFTRADVMDKPKLWRLLDKVDCVYHLAARVSVPESVRYPREYNATNVGGTVALMEAMRDAGVKRVVLASSGAIYGKQDRQPVAEKVEPFPASPYAVSKLAAEYYVRTIGALCKIETVALRIFNAYGPGQQVLPVHPPVIPQFMHRILGGGTLVVHGDGQQTRDFVFIDDVVAALAAAATAVNVDRRVINVGYGRETSINELVAVLEKVTGREAQVIHAGNEDGGVNRLVADLRLAHYLLDYDPGVDLEQGLSLLMENDAQFARLV